MVTPLNGGRGRPSIFKPGDLHPSITAIVNSQLWSLSGFLHNVKVLSKNLLYYI